MISYLRVTFLAAFLLFLLCAGTGSAELHFGAKFEPPDGRVLHGAGQSPDAFGRYWEALPETRPAIFMVYFGVHKLGAVEKQLKRYFGNYPQAMPQIGLAFAGRGPNGRTQDRLVEGKFDDDLRTAARVLRDTKRPVFIRPGYEFNGNWNAYDPDVFIEAFRKIVGIFRDEKAENVAFVWCYAAGGRPYFMQWYPGDEYVDWWGIDIFMPRNITSKHAVRFLDAAIEHRKPVMICESTPKKVGVLEGEKSWARWFEPYFDLVRSRNEIKGFCYINWDWANYPQWSDWGNARIELNEEVLKRYREEMKKPAYIHYSEGMYEVLGYKSETESSEANEPE